jgi:hypothetical protein
MPYLAGIMNIVRDAVALESRESPVIRFLASVVSACACQQEIRDRDVGRGYLVTCPARVNLPDEALIWGLPRDVLEDTLSHGGPADVAEADKEHRERL